MAVELGGCLSEEVVDVEAEEEEEIVLALVVEAPLSLLWDTFILPRKW